MTTENAIRNWFQDGSKKGYTHLIVVDDTFKHEDYPVYVVPTDNIHKIINEFSRNMQRVMEVYSYARDLETQLAEPHAYHLN